MWWDAVEAGLGFTLVDQDTVESVRQIIINNLPIGVLFTNFPGGTYVSHPNPTHILTGLFSQSGDAIQYILEEGYPSDPTYPDPLSPDDVGFSTRLVQGPVVLTINRNGVIVQDILELLADSNLAADQNPELQLDLNGFSLVDMADSPADNAPARM